MNKERRWILFWVILGTGLGTGFGYVYLPIVFRALAKLNTETKARALIEQHNADACHALKPGIKKDELIAALSQPSYAEPFEGKTVLSFPTPAILSGTIAAEIDDATGNVTTLWCGQEGAPPIWENHRKNVAQPGSAADAATKR